VRISSITSSDKPAASTPRAALRGADAAMLGGRVLTPGRQDAPVRGGAIAIGNFDGVHRGHKALFAKAKAAGAPVGALSFEPHPRSFFSGDARPFRLADPLTKRLLIAENGADFLFQPAFDHSLASLSAERFFEQVLVESLAAKAVVVGADFRFGHGREGDFGLLKRLGRRFGVSVESADLVIDGGQRISSSRIRAEIAAGRVREGNRLLGHCWGFGLALHESRNRARWIGYAPDGIMLPPPGTYRIMTTWRGRARNSGRPGLARLKACGMIEVELHTERLPGNPAPQQCFLRFLDRRSS